MRRLFQLSLLSYLLIACTSPASLPVQFQTWRLPAPVEDRDTRVPVVWLGVGGDQAFLGSGVSFSIMDKNPDEAAVSGMPASPAEFGELLAQVKLAADQSAVLIIADEVGAIRSVEASTQLWTDVAMENFALFAGEPVAGRAKQVGDLFTYTLEPLGTTADALLVVAVEFDNSRASGDIVTLWRLNPGVPSAYELSVIPSEAESALDIVGFIDALQQIGAQADPAGAFTAAFFTGTPRLLRVNGVDIQVYEYVDSTAAAQEARASAPEGESILPADWFATPHFYLSGRIIVQYIGDDQDTIALLESLLGPQFAGGPSTAATVQPPLMPTAQSTVTPRSLPSTVEEPLPRVTADLPSLPALTGPAIGGETPYADQLAAAAFTLDAVLPADPAAAPALMAPGPGDPTPEQVLAFARRLGLRGELQVLLQPQYPDRYWLDPAHEDLPRQFLIFDGTRTVSGLYYSDLRPDAINVQMPFARAVPIAERFLQSRGLLDFPYRVAPYSDSSFGVDFQQTVDGRPLLFPRISVGVDVREQVYIMQYSQFTGLTKVNDYPLRSAHDAWLTLAGGLATGETNFAIYPVPSEEIPPEETVEMWTRPFQDGQSVELISFITLPHQSFSGDQEIRIPAGPFFLEGSAEDLRAIAAEPLVHLWGTVRQEDASEMRLELEKWEPFGFQVARDTTGVIEEQDGKTLFRESGHDEIFILQDAPPELAAGDAVRVEGWFNIPKDNSLPRFEWFNIWRYGPALSSDATFPYKSPTIRQVIIDSVSLAYLPASNPITASLSGGPEQAYQLFQPVWLFSGRTDAGHLIELMARAADN